MFATLTDHAFAYAAPAETPKHGALARLAHWFAAWRQAARITAELESLSDETLADIGVTRSEIHAIAHGQLHRG